MRCLDNRIDTRKLGDIFDIYSVRSPQMHSISKAYNLRSCCFLRKNFPHFLVHRYSIEFYRSMVHDKKQKMKVKVNYQSSRVPRSLTSTHTIYVDRDVNGSNFANPVGLETEPTEVEIYNARNLDIQLDTNGCSLVSHAYPHIDYFEEEQIISKYYPECCKLVQKQTGAREVFAFDHNIRTSTKKSYFNERGESHIAVIKIDIKHYGK